MFRDANRGRLTVPDVAFMLANLALLAFLYPLFNQFFREKLNQMDPATAWLWRMLLPLLLLVILTMLWAKATAGVAR